MTSPSSPMDNTGSGDPDDKDIEVVFHPQEENKVDRGTWGGKVEFMMTCVGYAVGLGNVWRFPYLCFRNGGGAFLIPYCIMVGVIGLPLFFLEFAFGQFASLGPIEIWSISPLFKGLGYSMVAISWILCIYYNIIVARCLFFLGASFQWNLPWSNCNNTWNDPFLCREYVYSYGNESDSSLLKNVSNSIANSVAQVNTTTPSEDYYNNFVLEYPDGGLDDFGIPSWKMVLALLGCWIIVAMVLIKGVQSLGKISYFTAIFPYLVLISLFIRACMLKGAGDGIYYYLKPDFSRLTDLSVWTDAATQIFFSLSVCNGGLIAMSSFNKFKNNCYYDSVIIVMINCLTSVFSGMVVFANLGNMAYKKNVNITDVATEGSGLVFVVYPEALLQMPGSSIWAVIFFLMMLTLGLGSEFSMTECVLSGFQDVLIRRKIIKSQLQMKVFRAVMCAFNFLLGIPMVCRGGTDLLDLMDLVISSYPLLFVALCEIFVVSYCYGINQFKRDVALMINSKPNWYWRINWMVLTPLVTFLLLVFTLIRTSRKDFDKYPVSWRIVCELTGITIIAIIPIYFLWKYCKDGGFIVLRELIKPKQKWGPANKDDREQFHNMIRSNESMQTGKMTSKVDGRSLLQLVGSTGAGSTYNMHSSLISRNGGLAMATGIDDMSGSGFYQSKLSIADKLAEQYTKSLVKTNPELVTLLANPNTAAEAEAAAIAINQNSSAENDKSLQPDGKNTAIELTERDPKVRPAFQVGLDPLKSENESSTSQSSGSKPQTSETKPSSLYLSNLTSSEPK